MPQVPNRPRTAVAAATALAAAATLAAAARVVGGGWYQGSEEAAAAAARGTPRSNFRYRRKYHMLYHFKTLICGLLKNNLIQITAPHHCKNT